MAYPLIKVGYGIFEISADDLGGKLLFAGVRFLFAGLLVSAFCVCRKTKLDLKVRKDISWLLLLALVNTALHYMFAYIGLSNNTSGRSTILDSMSGFFLIFLSTVFFADDKLNKRKVIGCVMGFAGIVLINVEPGGNFFENIVNSLEKTLIRENRWKMILSGLVVTLELSAGAFILGCALGFLFCMLRRSRNKALSAFMNGFISLIDGIPALLVLLICFYVIFSKMGLKEIPVAIIAFSITFGCRVANVLNTGLNSVDRGEIEAAEAMGLSPLQIFTKIQFPQAVTLTFGMFKTQTVTMIKNTSIVGYIAVMDLTKASDIIRARTYESFFSLVFTAVIYFLITRAALALLSQFGNRIDPRRRAKK